MMRYFSLPAIAVLLLSQLSIKAQEVTLARDPAISPDGNTIAFSYQGDIWVKNLNGEFPRRLTIHEAYEKSPVFSPDGSYLAFTGNRFGNDDVFKVNVSGGTPERLTYHSTSDDLTDWTADDRLLFETRRAFAQVESNGEVYSISSEGGTPSRLLNAVGEMATASPDGRYIAFVRGVCRISREAYKGPSDLEIWLYDTKKETYTPVTDNQGNDYMPRWGKDNELYYLSSIQGRYNIVKVQADDEDFVREVVTTYSDYGIRHFDVGPNSIVFERDTHIYLKKGEADPEPVNLRISSDYRFDPVKTESYSANIEEYEVSPSGKYAASVIHGEVFVQALDKEKKRTVNISDHPYRDRSVTWLNDSNLIFTSDREGQYDLYLARSTDPEKPMLFNSLKRELVRITNTKEDEVEPVVSPDGKKIAFKRGRGELVVASISADGKLSNERNLLDGWATPGGLNWSPDSRFLAYHLVNLNFNSEVFIHPVDTAGEAVNVSMHPRGDYRPYWSEDGSKLGFVSSRNDGDMDVWFVWLKEEDWLKTEEDRKEGYYFSDPEPAKDTTKTEDEEPKEDKKEQESKKVKIDYEDIHDRLEQVTSLPGDEWRLLISRDGETFYFTGRSNVAKGSELYQVKYDGSEIKELTSGGTDPSGLRLAPDGKSIYYLKDGRIYNINPENKNTTRYTHVAVMTIDREKERVQMFEEAWSALQKGFYDPQFHGRNWDSLKAGYKPWVLAASTSQDFRDMFNLMLGELNASHMGLYGSNPEKLQSEPTGILGVEVKPAEEGGVWVTHVVPNSPADRPKSKLKEGDRILSVDGKEVTADINFHRLLAHRSGQQVLLLVANEEGRERELVIRPTSSIRKELYEEWVKERQKLTEEYSNGRLGYIHIQGMNKPSFERFERELMASGRGKEGIVIDVRFNGGGWTTDYLMAVLTVRQHAYTIPRGAAENLDKEHEDFREYYPYSERLPLSAWVKPSVAMCNESSYSNAEIFSHAYKNLDIGTLVGMPTFGAVISTGGMRLMDGSFVRMPFRAWYVKATDQNMENGPAIPDVVVDNQPGEKASGSDTQLKSAVNVLLMDIAQDGNE